MQCGTSLDPEINGLALNSMRSKKKGGTNFHMNLDRLLVNNKAKIKPTTDHEVPEEV